MCFLMSISFNCNIVPGILCRFGSGGSRGSGGSGGSGGSRAKGRSLAR
jgi:hypothetical protein